VPVFLSRFIDFSAQIKNDQKKIESQVRKNRLQSSLIRMMSMYKRLACLDRFIFSFCLVLYLFSAMEAQNKSSKQIAKGTFEVKVTPLAADDSIGDPTIGRLSLDKTWSGEMAGTSKGQMLGAQSETEKGSGGYVAMERFTGMLMAKKVAFHCSIMELWAAESLRLMFTSCRALEPASSQVFPERSRSSSTAKSICTNSSTLCRQSSFLIQIISPTRSYSCAAVMRTL